jgi:hypothetical protein
VKLGDPKVWVTLCSIGAVLAMAVVDVDRASPGPVSSVHAEAGAIEGGDSCSACHGGWFTSMTEACLECHAAIDEEIEHGHGLHGVIETQTAQSCALCHSEHHGSAFDVTNVRSFRLAGVPDPLEFDHERIGWIMDGRHLEIGCVECHENARVDVLEEGTHRFIGLSQDCASCHEDAHEGRMQIACASCHGQTTWDGLHSLGHEKHLPLTGGHGDVACRTCHAQSGEHALETSAARSSRPAARTCVECHESPHTHDFAAFSARLAGFDLERGCVACHAAEHAAWRESAATLTPGQHAFSGFALEAPHDDAACAGCHGQSGDFRARHPGRSPEACSVCHADPHGGQFATGTFAGQECTACHAALAFEPHAFTVEKHAATAMPLDGKHIDTQCNACHTIPGEDVPRTFHGVGSNCDACHADAHRGFFDEAFRDLEVEPPGACAVCHTTIGFDANVSDFDHAEWTGFPILGSHAQEDCASCHPSMASRDETKRLFGRVEEHFGTFDGCVTCHRDPHEGRFDAPGLPASIGDRTGCARCHEETSFRSFPREFEHGTWTGFALVEEHAQVDCAACHAQLRVPDAIGRTWGPANGSSCADCHADPHARQFDRGGTTDCERCHASQYEAFLAFDHERDSRFSLGEQHENLDCNACHLPFALPSGAEAVRYRPIGTECVDCHGVQEDVLIRRRRK